jgi:Lariat debranching enzyme, C-terminal domain
MSEHLFYYDAEWLTILKTLNPYFPLRRTAALPNLDQLYEKTMEADTSLENDISIPMNFEVIPPDDDVPGLPWCNPQTITFCSRFGLTNYPWAVQSCENHI